MESKNKVLICSKFVITKASLKSVLEYSYETQFCEKLEECKNIVAVNQIEHLILDLDDQEDVLNQIQQIKSSFPAIKTLIITKPKLSSTVEELKKIGIEQFLFKPILKEELLTIYK